MLITSVVVAICNRRYRDEDPVITVDEEMSLSFWPKGGDVLDWGSHSIASSKGSAAGEMSSNFYTNGSEGLAWGGESSDEWSDLGLKENLLSVSISVTDRLSCQIEEVVGERDTRDYCGSKNLNCRYHYQSDYVFQKSFLCRGRYLKVMWREEDWSWFRDSRAGIGVDVGVRNVKTAICRKKNGMMLHRWLRLRKSF